MKRYFPLMLAAVMTISSLCACTGRPQGGEPTAAPTQIVSNETAGPCVTEGPHPTLDPERQVFDPETDYDNRYGAIIDGAMIETEDAYYLYREKYLMYYDKAMEESGYLCPKPECVHGEKQDNISCNAYVNIAPGSLVYREGQLWWVGDTDFRHFAIFRMNLDGTGRERVHEFEYTGDTRGLVRFYLHRDHLFYVRSDQVVKNGEAFDTATFGCFDLDDYEKHVLAVRRSYLNPQPSIYFVGDSAYFFVSYDGITDENTDIPSEDYEYEAWLEWRLQIRKKDEILRWDPTMDEPETVYFNDEDGMGWGYYSCYAAEDGKLYFEDFEKVEPDQPDGAESWNYYISTVGADGKKERAISLVDENGVNYYPVVISAGVVFAANAVYERGRIQELNIWIIRLDGKTVYKGELPTAYREKYTNIARHGLSEFSNCWVTENELLIRFTEWYDSIGPNGSDMGYYVFVKYEITPDGLIEIPLLYCRSHFASGDESIPDFGE